MPKKLTILDEYNRGKINIHNKEPKPNNISCPDCNQELKDTSDSILSSHPIKINVYCAKCGYKGYRYT